MVEEKPVEIKFHFPQKKIHIVSVPVKVKQIFLNIASNSAKFTKKGVILFLIIEIKEGVSISIKDTGCGIKEENLRKIFNPYFKLEGNIYESSGLGLYITKHLLSILEGDIINKK
jgi:signal transduction histidine kinase